MDAMILPEGVPEKRERPVVRREQMLGDSKIDFKIGEKIFLEVKVRMFLSIFLIVSYVCCRVVHPRKSSIKLLASMVTLSSVDSINSYFGH